MGGKLAVVRILTEPESSVTSGLFMGGGTYGADHRSTRAKCQQGDHKVTTIAVRARQGGSLGAIDSDPLSFFARRDHLGHTTSVFAVCESMHATMQRPKWHGGPVGGRSGPAVGAGGAGGDTSCCLAPTERARIAGRVHQKTTTVDREARA